MPDPTTQPTAAPVPALPNVLTSTQVEVGINGKAFLSTPGVAFVERGDRAESTESRKAGAMDRMAGAVESANAQLLAALAQPVPVAPASRQQTYLDVLVKMAALPFMYDDKGRFDDERADGTARKILALYEDFE